MLQIVTIIGLYNNDRKCERLHEHRASKKLRLNPTIIDLIFWRSYFQIRARASAQPLQIATKIGLRIED